MLESLDECLLSRTARLVEWCEEWFSISQSQLEVGCIVVGALAAAVKLWPFPLEMGVEGLVVFWAYQMHRTPIAARRAVFRCAYWTLLRITNSAVACIGIATALYYAAPDTVAVAISVASTTLFFFLLAIAVDGERGKRRKLALDKLRQMFGSEWIPAALGGRA